LEEGALLKHTLSTVLAGVVLLATAGVASAQSQAQIDRGQQVFTAQKCSICHSVAGKGNKRGPLDGIGAKLSADEIRQWIVNAPEMAAKAKAARKPAMKAYATLVKDDLDALVAYIHGLKK
jgi:mono/diheme cytochrome c family protein